MISRSAEEELQGERKWAERVRGGWGGGRKSVRLKWHFENCSTTSDAPANLKRSTDWHRKQGALWEEVRGAGRSTVPRRQQQQQAAPRAAAETEVTGAAVPRWPLWPVETESSVTGGEQEVEDKAITVAFGRSRLRSDPVHPRRHINYWGVPSVLFVEKWRKLRWKQTKMKVPLSAR